MKLEQDLGLVRVKLAGKDFVGEQRELYMLEERPGEEAPYEQAFGRRYDGRRSALHPRRRHQVDVFAHALCCDEVVEAWMSV